MVGCVSGSADCQFELLVKYASGNSNLPDAGVTCFASLEQAKEAMGVVGKGFITAGAKLLNARGESYSTGSQARAEFLLGHESSQSKSRVLDRLKAFFAPVTDAMRALFQRFFGKEPAMASHEPAVSEIGSRPLPEVSPGYAQCRDHLDSCTNELYASVFKPSVMERSTSTTELQLRAQSSGNLSSEDGAFAPVNSEHTASTAQRWSQAANASSDSGVGSEVEGDDEVFIDNVDEYFDDLLEAMICVDESPSPSEPDSFETWLAGAEFEKMGHFKFAPSPELAAIKLPAPELDSDLVPINRLWIDRVLMPAGFV